MNKKWTCYTCGKLKKFSSLPNGYLANIQPLCKKCVNSILSTRGHRDRHRLTYHYQLGDFEMICNIPVLKNFMSLN